MAAARRKAGEWTQDLNIPLLFTEEEELSCSDINK